MLVSGLVLLPWIRRQYTPKGTARVKDIANFRLPIFDWLLFLRFDLKLAEYIATKPPERTGATWTPLPTFDGSGTESF